jgi:hypothetical protein
MNKRDYPTLHLHTNESKGMACGNKLQAVPLL